MDDPTDPASDLPPQPPARALVALLPPEVDLDPTQRHRLRHAAAREVWLAVVWGRLGRGELAWQLLDAVDEPTLQPWIAAERGRLLRELGLHGEAERWELPALDEATDPVDAAMLRISLAADAVGVGELATAQQRLAAARQAVAALPPGPRSARQRLRLSWVGVEVALASGQPVDTSRLAWWRLDDEVGDPALPDDHAAGSTFHTAKGLLFGGVVHREPRLLDAAVELAPPALAWAVHLAREDLGCCGALAAARAAWAAIVPPPGYEATLAATPLARRLTSSP